MQKNLRQRILTCVVGVPAVLAGIFLFPHYNYIVFSIFVIAISFIGSTEMSKILYGEIKPFAFIPPILPLLQYIQDLGDTVIPVADLLFIIMLLGSYATEIKIGESDNFKGSLERTAKSSLLIIYPSYFISFFIRLLSLDGINAYSISTFLLLVFGNDIFAYVFGMLFGKGNKGIFQVSPKKSVAGFIGGYISCVALCFLCFAVFPEESMPQIGFFHKFLLGTAVSITANIGDLLESVFKRSAGVKDSGNVIPGRGGILDCCDSIISSAPFFYILFRIAL